MFFTTCIHLYTYCFRLAYISWFETQIICNYCKNLTYNLTVACFIPVVKVGRNAPEMVPVLWNCVSAQAIFKISVPSYVSGYWCSVSGYCVSLVTRTCLGVKCVERHTICVERIEFNRNSMMSKKKCKRTKKCLQIFQVI